MSEVNLPDVAAVVAEKNGIFQENVEFAVKEFFSVMAHELPNAHGYRVELNGIGVFKLKKRAARKGMTPPPDSQPWEMPEHYEVVFSASPAFSKAIADQLGAPVL